MTERDLFLALLDLPDPAARAAYLDKACAGNAALRAGVEALLRSHDTAGSFLGSPAFAPTDPNVSATQEVCREATSDDRASLDEALTFLAPSGQPDSLGRLKHYEVLEVLGRGGFGIVLRAFDEVLQRVVAVKVLAPHLAATSPARKRFLREARSSAKVRHQNVVQVYAVEEQPLPYLVMEFIPGETLQQRLDRTGPLETLEVVHIGRQVAEGLAAAHSTGLIHRDIKPSNILIEAGPHHHVKITDFGLARAADDASLTQSGLVAGTPMFMSPEQAKGEPIDYRADLFSLGSVLYTMASGRPPFRAPSTLAVLKRVAEGTPRPIPEIIPEVPQWLCDIITRLHAKKPEDRFASAQEVADLLTRHLAQMPHPGDAPTLPEVAPAAMAKRPPVREIPEAAPAIRPRFRTRRWVAAAVVLLLLLAGGLGYTEATGVTNVRGTVIRLFSPEGTLVVEVDDPEVSVKIDGPDLVITGAGAKEIRLKPGNYTVEASKDGKVVSRELVSVAKNGRQVVRVSRESPQADTKGARPSADASAWERSVAAMPAAEQVKAVSARLMQRNLGFDGKVMPTIENDVVTGLEFQTDHVSDISPVRGLTRLRSLNCSGTDLGRGQLSDLSPLRGLPLTDLSCLYNPVSDLSPLKDMELTGLDCRHTNVSDADVKNLVGLKTLQRLSLWGTKVTDAGLKDLAGLKSLQWLSLETTQVTDAGLKELAGLQSLTHLSLYNAEHVTDAGLKELAGLKALKWLDLRLTRTTDAGVKNLAAALPSLRIERNGGVIEPTVEVTPPAPTVHDTWIKALALLPLDMQGAALAAKMKEQLPGFEDAFLKAIPALSAERQAIMVGVWLKERKPAFAGLEDAWLKAIPAMPADAQVVLVAAWLKERNPAFDGEEKHKIEGGVLTTLEVPSPLVQDLTPLRTLTRLRTLTCRSTLGYDNKAESDAAVLRSLKTLENINGKPVAQFWKEVDGRQAEFKEWLRLVPALTAEQQVAAVAARLKEHNPGFDGKVWHKIEGGVVTEIVLGPHVADLSPARALVGLKSFGCDQLDGGRLLTDLSPLKDLKHLTSLALPYTPMTDLSQLKDMKLTSLDVHNTPVSDLTPVKDMKLASLNLYMTRVTDLSPLKGMELTSLNFGRTGVTDLSPLKDMKLTSLNFHETEVTDLSPLKGMPLTELDCSNTKVSDLSPLQGMPLEAIRLSPKNITKGLDILRDMKSLKTIGIGQSNTQAWPAAEFWDRYDKGEFKE